MTRRQLLDLALAVVDGNEAQLAQRLGMTNVNSAATEFNRWRKGKSMAFERTMALLEIAGLLREEPATSLSEAEVVAVLDQATQDLVRLAEQLRHGRTAPPPPQPAKENGDSG